MKEIDEYKSRILECVKNFPAHELKEFMSYWDSNDDRDKWKEVKDNDLESRIKEYIKTLNPEDLQDLEKFISRRLDNSKKHLLSQAIERIKNLSDEILDGFSNSDTDFKSFSAAQESLNLNIKSKFENYVNTLSNDALALEKFLSDLSDFIKKDIISELKFDEWFKNASSEDVKKFIDEYQNHIKISISEESKSNTEDAERALKTFFESISKSQDPRLIDCPNDLLCDLIESVIWFSDDCFNKFERANYYDRWRISCIKNDYIRSNKFLHYLTSVLKNKRRKFLSELNLDDFIPGGKYSDLKDDYIGLNEKNEKKLISIELNCNKINKETCLNWRQIYVIQYVAKIKNILSDKKLNDTEKLDKINELTKNITWDEFKKISVLNHDKLYTLSRFKNKVGEGQVPAYLFLLEFFAIYKFEFCDLIEADKDLKKMFDAKKILNLICMANDAPTFIRVLSFIFFSILTVVSFGLFALDKRVMDGLKSLSKPSFKSAILKDIISEFRDLSEKLNKKPLGKLNAKVNNTSIETRT